MTTQQVKVNITDIINQIEIETEKKVLEGYKSGQIKLLPDKDSYDKQVEIIKNIMEEGAKKFEAASGKKSLILK
jgi:hypothetical protein